MRNGSKRKGQNISSCQHSVRFTFFTLLEIKAQILPRPSFEAITDDSDRFARPEDVSNLSMRMAIHWFVHDIFGNSCMTSNAGLVLRRYHDPRDRPRSSPLPTRNRKMSACQRHKATVTLVLACHLSRLTGKTPYAHFSSPSLHALSPTSLSPTLVSLALDFSSLTTQILTPHPFLLQKPRRSPEHRRPTPLVRAASKSPSFHVAHVVHGSSRKPGPRLCWERPLLCIDLIRPHSYVPLFYFRSRSATVFPQLL